MRKWLIRFSLLIGLLIIGLGLLLANPNWLSPLIEKKLKQQGITADIEYIQADFAGRNYQLTTLVNAKSQDFGLDVNQAKILVTLDWLALLKQKPFIKHAKLNGGGLSFDKQSLPHWKSTLSQLKRTSSDNEISRYLPLEWSVNQWKINIDGQQLMINSQGFADKKIQATLSDHASGYLNMDYAEENHVINLHSEQLNLAAITGYQAELTQFDAKINTLDWADITLNSQLLYQGIPSEIKIKGQNNVVELAANVNGEQIAATVKYGEHGGELRFNQLNLLALKGLKPLLPKQFMNVDISGQASGVVEYARGIGVRMAAVNASQVSIQHPDFAVSELSGRFWLQNKQLKYRLNIDNGTLLFPNLFEQVDNVVTASVVGIFDTQKKLLTIDKMAINSKDFQQLTASGSVQLAANPILDIKAELHNADIAKAPRYLPKMLPKQAKRWLRKAFVAGDQNYTTLQLKGELKQLFESEESVFLINSQLKNSELHYLPKNPNVKFKKAQLVVDKKALSVTSSDAKVGGLPLSVSADIDDLLHASVNINAKMNKQTISKMQAVASKSIAKNIIQEVKKIVKAEGAFDLGLLISLNFADTKSPHKFSIQLDSDNANVALKKYPDFAIKKAKTIVRVDEKGMQAVTVKGKVNGQPIQLNIDATSKGYAVDTTLTADIIKVLSQFKLITGSEKKIIQKSQLLSGKSRYKVSIDLAANGSLRRLDVASALVGTTINLFDAIKKPAKQKNALILSYNEAKKYLKLHIDKLLMVKAGLNKTGSLAGLVIDNQVKKTTYQSGLIKANFKSSRLNASALKSFIEAYQLRRSELAGRKKQTKQKPIKYQVNFDIKKVTFENGKSYPVLIKGDSSNIRLDSPVINGNIQFLPKQMNAQLARAEIDTLFNLFKKTAVNPGGRQVAKISLTKNLPQVDINVEKVIFSGKNIGNLHLETSIKNGLYSIDQGLLSGAHYFVEISGYEVKEPQGITTYVQMDFKSENLLNVIRNYSLNEVLDAKNLDISTNLAWPGKAYTLDLQKSYGKASLNALNVRLLTIDSGVGSVFGLMDTVGILKRISSDFKNLNSSKISFDTVKGSWNIGGGRAVTRGFYADGSVIALKIDGAVDLYRRTFDNVKLSVIPRASNILPIVGAVTGGVVGVAAGLFLQQVVGDNLDEIVGVPYEIIGSWDKPSVVPVGSQKTTKPSD